MVVSPSSTSNRRLFSSRAAKINLVNNSGATEDVIGHETRHSEGRYYCPGSEVRDVMARLPVGRTPRVTLSHAAVRNWARPPPRSTCASWGTGGSLVAQAGPRAGASKVGERRPRRPRILEPRLDHGSTARPRKLRIHELR
jgi:hypothetical protein